MKASSSASSPRASSSPTPSCRPREVDKLHARPRQRAAVLRRERRLGEIDREQRHPRRGPRRGSRSSGSSACSSPRRTAASGSRRRAYARVMQEVGGLDWIARRDARRAPVDRAARGSSSSAPTSRSSATCPRLATGEMVAAFALTEPGAGSDAAAIQTRAELQPDGGYVLNGSKIWITNGGFADVFTVFARTSPRDEGVKPKITAFLVERGVGREERAERAQARHPRQLDDRGLLRRRARARGERARRAGRGFKVAMEVLNSGRLGLASGCVGPVQAAHQDGDRARARSGARSAGPSASSASSRTRSPR